MAPSAIYARSRLGDAIAILASHPGDIRQRLKIAANEVLLIPMVGLPTFENVARDILWIQTRLTSHDPRFEGQGRLAATLYGMRSATAATIVERILTAESKLDVYVQMELRCCNEANPRKD